MALGLLWEESLTSPSGGAEQGRRKANKTPSPKREQKLTRRMLETIGRTNDPTLRIEAEEAAWQRLLEEAHMPSDRAKLHSMTAEQKASLIQLALERYKDELKQSDDDGS